MKCCSASWPTTITELAVCQGRPLLRTFISPLIYSLIRDYSMSSGMIRSSKKFFANLIDFNPKTVAYTSNYFVQKLFSNYLGTEYVGFDDKLPEHVFASVTEDEDAYYLKLVNTGELEDEAQIAFPKGISSAVGEIMQSNDLTLRNGLGFYGETDYRIVPQKTSAAVEGNCVKADVRAHSVLVLKISK